MLPIAGLTPGPIGQTFLVDTQGWPGGVLGLTNRKFFFQINFFQLKKTFFSIFFPRAMPGSSARIT